MEAILLNAITGPEVVALVALMLGNLGLSITVSLYKGNFSFAKLGDFVSTRVVPLIGYFIVAALASVVDDFGPIAVVTALGLGTLYSTGILKALRSMGLKVPEVMTEKDRVAKR